MLTSFTLMLLRLGFFAKPTDKLISSRQSFSKSTSAPFDHDLLWRSSFPFEYLRTVTESNNEDDESFLICPFFGKEEEYKEELL